MSEDATLESDWMLIATELEKTLLVIYDEQDRVVFVDPLVLVSND